VGVSAALVYGWCNAGLLAHHRLGLPGHRGRIRIAEADLDAFLASQRREAPASKPAMPKRRIRLNHLELPN
jgi:hypothetical protein